MAKRATHTNETHRMETGSAARTDTIETRNTLGGPTRLDTINQGITTDGNQAHHRTGSRRGTWRGSETSARTFGSLKLWTLPKPETFATPKPHGKSGAHSGLRSELLTPTVATTLWRSCRTEPKRPYRKAGRYRNTGPIGARPERIREENAARHSP